MGKAAPQVTCFGCERQVKRDYSFTQYANFDPFRTTWLSTRKTEDRMAKQQRPLDPIAPKDIFEARDRQRTHGRIYIGDNVDMLNPTARKAIVEDAGDLRKHKKYDRELIKNGNGHRTPIVPLPDVPESQHPLGPARPWDKTTAKVAM